MFHGFLNDAPCGQTELLPFGQQQESVCVEDSVIHVAAINDLVTYATAALIHGDGIIDTDSTTGLDQLLNHHQGSGLTHVIRLWLERQAPHGDGLPLQALTLKGFLKFLEEHTLLFFVHPLNSFQHLHRVAILVSRLDESLHILREARTAIAAAGIEELTSDTGVGTNTCTNHIHVGTHSLTQIGNIIHERDTGSQHRVGGIFGHLS